MKKIIFTALALILSAASLMAESTKPRLYVEFFEISSDATEADGGKIRQAVIDALTKTQRFEIVTEDSQSSLQEETIRRASSTAMHDEKARTENISAAAHDYILKGTVHSCSYSVTTLEDGTKTYSCAMNFSLSATEVATSTTIATKQFDNQTGLISGALYSGSSPEVALTNALSQIEKKITDFVIEFFPNKGTIIPSDYVVKKDKLVSCYIDLGSDNGVKKGDLFVVMGPKVIVGKLTYTEIGKIKVEEVVSGEISQCKVTAGAKEIFQAIQEFMSLDENTQKEQPIKIESDTKFGIDQITKFI